MPKAVKSSNCFSEPKILASKGIIILFTSELTILPKAPPMTTPIAKSITLPLKANCLNSFHIG